jgi:hypothetical protein
LRKYSSFLADALEIENSGPFELLVCGGVGCRQQLGDDSGPFRWIQKASEVVSQEAGLG